MGYGTRALELLTQYYQGEITNLQETETDQPDSIEGKETEEEANMTLQTEELKPRKNLPPLLVELKDRPAERLHYLGTSYGLTGQLFSFWKKSSFYPVYIRQTPVFFLNSQLRSSPELNGVFFRMN